MNFKSLILLSYFLTGSVLAAGPDHSKCLEEHPQKRTVYRDDAGVVTCVNYGGKKAVEYSYNKIKGFTLGKQKYAQGSLIGKKFHGFESVTNSDTYYPNSEKFHGTVLKDLFKEINQVTTLDQLIQKHYPNVKKQNQFVRDIAQEYMSGVGKEIPAEFEEKTLVEKLNFIQNEMNLETPPTLEDLNILEMEDSETMKARVHLFSSDRQKMSISQCNPAVVNSYQKVFGNNSIAKKTMETPRLFAETNVYEDQIKIILGTFFLENLLDKTIEETKVIMKDIPMNVKNEIVMKRYNRHGGEEHEFPELPVFTRVLVHELGHFHQFSMLRQPNSPYELYKLYLNLASRLAAPDKFLQVPSKFKKELDLQIFEPVMNVFEYSAESYFVDAIPCVL